MIVEIIIVLLFIAGFIYDGTATLLLNRTFKRMCSAETEKTPSLLEKNRVKGKGHKTNRLTNGSKKWLVGREKMGKE